VKHPVIEADLIGAVVRTSFESSFYWTDDKCTEIKCTQHAIVTQLSALVKQLEKNGITDTAEVLITRAPFEMGMASTAFAAFSRNPVPDTFGARRIHPKLLVWKEKLQLLLNALSRSHQTMGHYVDVDWTLVL